MKKEQIKKELIETLSSTPNVDNQILDKFIQLIHDQPDTFFGKKSEVAHMTASALVINDDMTEVLLTNHKKLKEWLQLGGHWCDYEDFPSVSILQAAMKEVEEEGYNDARIEQNILLDGKPLDLDIHGVGTHAHYDVCFLTQVSKSIPVCVSDESEDVKWIAIDHILKNENSFNDRLVRMCQKVATYQQQYLLQSDTKNTKHSRKKHSL